MRGFFYVLSAAIVMALATWAYNENYRTQALLRQIDELNADIAGERERLAVLEAEWAWLKRPERLRELVEWNYDRLGLLPLSPEHFGSAGDIAYPAPPEATYLIAEREGEE